MAQLILSIVVLQMILTLIQIGVKMYIFYPIWKASQRTLQLVQIAEAHGALTDSQKMRMEHTMQRAINVLDKIEVQASTVAATAAEGTAGVRKAVEEVPTKTAKLVVEKIQEQH